MMEPSTKYSSALGIAPLATSSSQGQKPADAPSKTLFYLNCYLVT